jgi:hypothetical protein
MIPMISSLKLTVVPSGGGLKSGPGGIEVTDMMKRQERTFCTLMIPVSVEIHHKRYVAIAESHRLERSIMILML